MWQIISANLCAVEVVVPRRVKVIGVHLAVLLLGEPQPAADLVVLKHESSIFRSYIQPYTTLYVVSTCWNSLDFVVDN